MQVFNSDLAKIEEICKQHHILFNVKQNTINDYFWTSQNHTKKPYKYLLKKRKHKLGENEREGI